MGAAPAGGGNKALKYVGIGCGVLVLLSCLAWAGCYACSMMAAGGAVAAGGGMGGATCERAVQCCQAYMSTVPGAAGTVDCNIYANSIEIGCQSAIDGYRAGIQALGQPVPAACQ